jgi:hypothetical protein
MGLDRDDPLIRRRLRARLESEADAQVPQEPSDAALAAFFAAHAGEFRGADGRVPELAQVRQTVAQRWFVAEVLAARARAYEGLRRRYTVRVEGPTPAPSP